MNLKIISDYSLKGDQPQAVDKLVASLTSGKKYAVLLGVTGSGKTYTVANVIAKLGKPALIISHNKTLAAQLYQEFRDFFPDNGVSYFVSYYDYYQPEAYIPSTDTYIEKDSDVNELIDKLRLAATTNIMTRRDVVTVASVSCIYNIGSPQDYQNYSIAFKRGDAFDRRQLAEKLALLQYERGEFSFARGTFRVVGETLDVYPAYEDIGVRVVDKEGTIVSIQTFNPVSGKVLKDNLETYAIYPAKHFVTDLSKQTEVFSQIRKDMEAVVAKFKESGHLLEAQRIKERVSYDLEMMEAVGYVKGIENYSRYFDGRKPGDPPNTLIDYYNKAYGSDWLLIVDESHMTFPQIRGMYAGDLSRKTTLIDYGFRLPSALDNRPLTFDEFMRIVPNFLAVSATPDKWEVSIADNNVVEQLVRPTGIPDPSVEVRPVTNQVQDVVDEIEHYAKKHMRVLVTTLTKQTAEDLTAFLTSKGLRVHYLHSDVATLERSDIIENLRRGTYDCLVGINLLREGLDLPEVALVAILDADKEGFLRSRVSLIQTMGRAARHIEGKVILYADRITDSIKAALEEVDRRRRYQLDWNQKYHITPSAISKPIRSRLVDESEDPVETQMGAGITSFINHIRPDDLTPYDKKRMIARLKREMRLAAADLKFELAAAIRDKLLDLE